MKISHEPFEAPADLLRLIRESNRGIRPDRPELATWHESYVANHTHRIALDLRILRSTIAPGSRVLEFGCVPLMLSASLPASGYDVTGVDIAPERYATSLARLGMPVLKCDIEREPLPFEQNAFDAAAFFELFEHLRINPIFTLREVARVLKPSGVLLLSTPNLKSLDGLRNFWLRDRAYSCCGELFEEYEKLERLGHMGHVREYTKSEVVSFLGKIGFEVVELIYRGGYGGYRQPIVRLLPALRPFITYVARTGP